MHAPATRLHRHNTATTRPTYGAQETRPSDAPIGAVSGTVTQPLAGSVPTKPPGCRPDYTIGCYFSPWCYMMVHVVGEFYRRTGLPWRLGLTGGGTRKGSLRVGCDLIRGPTVHQ